MIAGVTEGMPEGWLKRLLVHRGGVNAGLVYCVYNVEHGGKRAAVRSALLLLLLHMICSTFLSVRVDQWSFDLFLECSRTQIQWEEFVVANNVPVENCPSFDFTKESFPASSFRDYDESTGTSSLHAEVQRGRLLPETMGRLFETSAPVVRAYKK